jgi:hypothetical protein
MNQRLQYQQIPVLEFNRNEREGERRKCLNAKFSLQNSFVMIDFGLQFWGIPEFSGVE